MDAVVELDGTRYLYSGGEWYHAETFLKPPYAVVQRLNRLLPQQPAPARPPKSAGATADDDATFSHDELFPIIAGIITQASARTDDYVTHDEIVARLQEHPEGHDLVMLARQRQGDDKPPAAVAANIVAWFSQRYTVRTSDYQDVFERERIDGKWAYRPVQDRRGE